MSSGSAASRRSWSSELEEGGTPRAVRARRREGEGSSLSELAKRVKASLISDSMAAEILCSLARADWRGAFSLGAGVGTGARRLGGYNKRVRRAGLKEGTTYHCGVLRLSSLPTTPKTMSRMGVGSFAVSGKQWRVNV